LVGASITWAFEEGEEVDYQEMWAEIDQQVGSQTDIDPNWIKTSETRKDYKVNIHMPKNGSNQVSDY
jgi:hypothetical protein